MAKGYEVLEMLRPEGGWAITGDEYENAQFIDCKPVTEKEFTDAFKLADAWLAKKEAEAAAKKQSILDRLGITEDEAKLLLA